MKELGYAGFGFAMGALASFFIIIVLLFLGLMPSMIFYSTLVMMILIFGLLGFFFSVLQVIEKDYPFVIPTLLLNIILLIVSMVFILL